MGKSLRSQAQKRNRAVMREKVFGPAREKVELEIAKRLHGEETLKRKAQEKAEKENEMETDGAPKEDAKPKVGTGGFGKKKKKARKINSSHSTFKNLKKSSNR